MPAAIRSLTRREQLMLGGLGLFLVTLAVLFFVVMPFLSWTGEARSDYAAAKRLASLARNAEPQTTEPVDDRALRSVVTDLADQRQIVYTRINSSSDGSLQVDLVDVPYGKFFGWLSALEREGRIVVTEAYLTTGEQPDTIEARISLMRAE